MTLEDRLDNWGRALRSHRPRGKARSFEGRYRSPQSRHWELPATTLRGSPDHADAMTVERAWASLPLPPKLVLRGHYCLLWTPERYRRVVIRLHIPRRPYHADLAYAESLIALALERTEAQNRSLWERMTKISLDLMRDAVYNPH